MAKNINQFSEFSYINFGPGISFTRKVIWWWLPLLYLLISDTFYLRTYDSAQVKITLLQMGGISLLGLWVSLLLLEGRNAFRKEDFVFLAPFFAYLLYIIISFFHAPYKGWCVDDFTRYILYMGIALIVVREFNESAIDRLTKILIITAYITVIYGFIQWIDTRFFPSKDIGPGIDPFIWRGAFGTRVFSTYGNPNFFGNFLVLILPVIITQFLKTKSVYLIPLIVLNLLCLYVTETKGAWLGFGVSSFIFVVFYFYFFSGIDKKKLFRITAVAVIVPLIFIGYVLNFARKSPTSIPFRIATWLSTWEIIETHPLIGSGVGSFKVLYPAFRRPIIFHLEGKHNTETDHAENEHLEQWLDNGLIGFGIFIWLIAFVTIVGLRGLNSMTQNLKTSRAPPRAYDLLGYLTALLGMLIHNFTDVSMRFVSSGVYLGLLPGVIINLARGNAIWELHYRGDTETKTRQQSSDSSKYPFLLWGIRIISILSLVYVSYLIVSEFSNIQGPLRMTHGGETLQWWISWSVLLTVVVLLTYSFARIILTGISMIVPIVVILMLFPLYYFWGWFKADVYHNMAIFFSKQGKWDEAISYYRKVNKHNQFFVMPYYFTGNVFNDRFNMNKQYRPEWGDKDNIPRDDFERALDAYEKVRKLAPNYVQMHHQVGILYMKMHDHLNNQGKPDEAKKYLDKALARFELSHNLDPVFPYNYYRKAQIYIAKQEFEKAEKEYLENISARKCHRKGHLHESPEAYTNLANLRYVMGKIDEAIKDYQRAVELNPDYEPAKRNLEILKQKFQINVVPEIPKKSIDTDFEIPSKRK